MFQDTIPDGLRSSVPDPTPPEARRGTGVAQPGACHLDIRFSGSGSEYFRIWIVNLLLTIVTLGIYYPWAKVRQTRYQLEHMAVDSDGNLSSFMADASPKTSALGEEAGDFFDVDFGL